MAKSIFARKVEKNYKNRQKLQYMKLHRNIKIQEIDLIIVHQQFTAILLNIHKLNYCTSVNNIDNSVATRRTWKLDYTSIKMSRSFKELSLSVNTFSVIISIRHAEILWQHSIKRRNCMSRTLNLSVFWVLIRKNRQLSSKDSKATEFQQHR